MHAKASGRPPQRRPGVRGVLALLAATAALACGPPSPRAIAFNEDACAYCKMTISDPRFGGEVVTRTGRVETFDSIDCMTAWIHGADTASIAGIYVLDFEHPGALVDVKAAGFLRGISVQAPMGNAIAAFATPGAAEGSRGVLGGSVVAWGDLLAGTGDAHTHTTP
ncbi:MAG: nitrous oxide reductase accessory protein NosL [Gemmatimonadaceae bacterium]|nr:nitrous oxide reductase accessory protein NosL [Gemmatimonadaceae bacterium]